MRSITPNYSSGMETDNYRAIRRWPSQYTTITMAGSESGVVTGSNSIPASVRTGELDSCSLSDDDEHPGVGLFNEVNGFDSRTVASQLKARVRKLESEVAVLHEQCLNYRKQANDLQREKLESSSDLHNKVNSLNSELARYKTQVERAEASKQGVNLELLKQRKVSDDLRNCLAEKEKLFAESENSYRDQLRRLNEAMQDLRNRFNDDRNEAEQQQAKYRLDLQNKQQELAETQAELCLIRKERGQLVEDCRAVEARLDSLKRELSRAEEAKVKSQERLVELEEEMILLRESDRRLQDESQTQRKRLSQAERLFEESQRDLRETKFNVDVLNSRINELQSQLDAETKNANELGQQLHDTRDSLSTAEQDNRDLIEQLRSVETDRTTLVSQLEQQNVQNRDDLFEKQTLIDTLTSELKAWEDRFHSLKDNLDSTALKANELEQTYDGAIKKLNRLFVEHNAFFARIEDNQFATVNFDGLDLDALVERIVIICDQYQMYCEKAWTNEERQRHLAEQLRHECQQLRSLTNSREETITETKKGLETSQAEAARLQTLARDLETAGDQLRAELSQCRGCLDEEKSANQQLRSKLEQAERRFTALDEKLRSTLGHAVSCCERITGTRGEQRIDSHDGVLLAIDQQLAELIGAYTRKCDDVEQLRRTARDRAKEIERLRHDHQRQTDWLNADVEKRMKDIQAERDAIENRYEQLLAEAKRQLQAAIDNADGFEQEKQSVGERLEQTEEQLKQAGRQLKDAQQSSENAMALCTLLCVVIKQLANRLGALIEHKQLLLRQVGKLSSCRKQCILIHDNLGEVQQPTINRSMEPAKSFSATFVPKESGLLRFRRVAVTIMAANRFMLCAGARLQLTSSSSSSKLDNGNDTGGCGESFSVKLADFRLPISLHHRERALSQIIANEVKGGGACSTLFRFFSSALAESDEHMTKRACAQCLDSVLADYLNDSSTSAYMTKINRYQQLPALLRDLQNGLQVSLNRQSLSGKLHLVPLQQLLTLIHHRSLDVVQLANQLELERRALGKQMTAMHMEQNSRESALIDSYKQQISQQRQHMAHMVEKNQFTAVCDELHAALLREQEAERLLKQESEQMGQMNRQLIEMERRDSEMMVKWKEAEDSAERKEMRIVKLNGEVAALKEERDATIDDLRAVERLIERGDEDLDAIGAYLRDVLEVFESNRHSFTYDGNECDNVMLQALRAVSAPVLKTRRRAAGDKASASSSVTELAFLDKAELLATCRRLVECFAFVQQRLLNRISGLNDQIRSHKNHIRALKEELNVVQMRYKSSLASNGPTTNAETVGAPKSSSSSGVVSGSNSARADEGTGRPPVVSTPKRTTTTTTVAAAPPVQPANTTFDVVDVLDSDTFQPFVDDLELSFRALPSSSSRLVDVGSKKNRSMPALGSQRLQRTSSPKKFY